MKRLDRKAVDALFREYKATGNVSIRNQIVENFIPMAASIANKLKDRLPASVDINDLVSSGVMGLMNAIESYDVDRGVSFSSFANRRVYGEMIDDLRKNEWGSRVFIARYKKIEEAKDAFFVRTGQRPGEAELQAELGPNDYELIAKAQHRRCRSLSDQIFEGEHRTVDRAETIPAPEPEYDLGDRIDVKQIIEKIALPDHGIRSALILKLHYLDGMTLKRIADLLQVSESRISQIHKNLLGCLKSKMLRQRRAA